MKPCPCGSGKYIAKEGGDGKCADCRRKRKQRKPREDAITRQARLVYEDVDRTPDSDPNDIERDTP